MWKDWNTPPLFRKITMQPHQHPLGQPYNIAISIRPNTLHFHLSNTQPLFTANHLSQTLHFISASHHHSTLPREYRPWEESCLLYPRVRKRKPRAVVFLFCPGARGKKGEKHCVSSFCIFLTSTSCWSSPSSSVPTATPQLQPSSA